jgi:transposase
MEVLSTCCCGSDVHAKSLVACLIKQGKKESRTFSTMTDDVLRLRDWLTAEGCTPVAIESTGVSWRPVFNILEGALEVMLVNARDAKGFKARQTDVSDAAWLADLRRHGLVKPSVIPPRPLRERRELTRYRASLLRDRTALANRIQKLVESGHIKRGHVASDALGVRGPLMLRALAKGETAADKRSELARGRLKGKRAALKRALEGRLTEAQRWILGQLLDHYAQVEATSQRVEEQITQAVDTGADPCVAAAVRLLETIPGVAAIVAQTRVAEIGVEMSRFPTAKHLARWAGRCPGTQESAGKRQSGKTTKGSRYLRAALVQAAWAASHQQRTSLAAPYRRLVKRLGKKKALVAVGHAILVMAYHVLKHQAHYRELGGDYVDHRHVAQQRKRLIRQLEALGLKVTVEEVGQVACQR